MMQALPDSGIENATIRSMTAPTGGWNAFDPIADMPEGDAIFLDNFFPRTGDVMLRLGRERLASLPQGSRIKTLLGYSSPTGVKQLFAASNMGIYSLVNPEAPMLVSPATNGEWQSVSSTTSGGSFLLAVNGADDMRLYNGDKWQELNATSTPAVTGVPSKELVNISKFKTRIIFCRKDSLSFYYLPTNAIAGALTEFPLGPIFSRGGYLMATATWTIDGGNGPDDYFMAITSEGEVAVYSGTDPASDFRKVGTFQLSKPMGRRCVHQLADDVILLTQGAIFPLSKSISRGLVDRRIALSRRIERAYSAFTAESPNLFGWESTFFPEANMLLVNVPTKDYEAKSIKYSYQFVMNTTTGKWCRFTNWNADTFLAFDGKLYCALFNNVWECWTGHSDDGADIVGNAKTAASSLGRSTVKQVTMIRPMLQTSGPVTLQLALDVDYRDNTLVGTSASYTQLVAQWDSAIWNTSRWSGANRVLSVWRSVNCPVGRMVSARLRCASRNVSMSWIATDFILKSGGIKG